MLCPTVTVDHPLDNSSEDSRASFAVSISGGSPDSKFTFKWSVSAGTIIAGQGTPNITVDTTGLEFYCLKASVEVGENQEGCESAASDTALVGVTCTMPRKFDEYGNISFKDERVRLDNLAAQLKEEPNSEAHLLAFDTQRGRKGLALKRIKRAKTYLMKQHNIEANRIVIMNGAEFLSGPTYKSELTTELYIWPKLLKTPCQ